MIMLPVPILMPGGGGGGNRTCEDVAASIYLLVSLAVAIGVAVHGRFFKVCTDWRDTAAACEWPDWTVIPMVSGLVTFAGLLVATLAFLAVRTLWRATRG